MPTAERHPGPASPGTDRPKDPITLTRVLEELARRGYTETFSVSDGQLRAVSTGQLSRAEDGVIHEYRRFEGVSDPDDMAIVYAIETSAGLRGTLVDAFGVYADPAIGEVVKRIPVRPEHA